ncbi:MAG: hypothetical protein MMC33_008380 [Icmadophila ericetorum]|nr:hypothetical protein [Icmadophila ericetorum]
MFNPQRSMVNVLSSDEEDVALDVDEPPDNHIHFSRLPTPRWASISPGEVYFRLPNSHMERKESLLTQALLTSPTLGPMLHTLDSTAPRTGSTASNYSIASAASTAELTSDGGQTSPARSNTPSPPMPPMNNNNTLTIITPKALLNLNERFAGVAMTSDITSVDSSTTHKEAAAASGKKRCITFACAADVKRQETSVPPTALANAVSFAKNEIAAPLKRPCTLRFACPAKITFETNGESEEPAKTLRSRTLSPPPKVVARVPTSTHTGRGESQPPSQIDAAEKQEKTILVSTPKGLRSSRKKFRSEGIRFHEFASSYREEDEWLHQVPTPRHKITVTDTLRKENAIRKLGEEAEEEAQAEEDAEEEAEMKSISDDVEDIDEIDEDNDDEPEDNREGDSIYSDNDNSSGGNETDDEGGFADSEDESDNNSEYQFWTPGLTTAATSTDRMDHAQSRLHRVASESSIESIVNFRAVNFNTSEFTRNPRMARKSRKRPKMRPGTPELPDSTDFVCGTLDEDRPLEAAYMSCLEQRRKAKHHPVPQDVDPSFPTSDFEEDEDDDGEAEDASDDHIWVTGRPDDSDMERRRGSRKPSVVQTSQQRLRSPPPSKIASKNTSKNVSKVSTRHSSPRRYKSPPPPARKGNLKTPPLSRRTSVFSPPQQVALDMDRLAFVPAFTHTKSLPRTPAPVWSEFIRRPTENTARAEKIRAPGRTIQMDSEQHTRGPIDIKQGLEKKRQRRKEKFLRQYCRNAGKEKVWHCQPGKGAERMRELGLEMAGKRKAYGEYILSI